MPVLSSSYRSPWLFRNGHVQTIYPNLCRRAPKIGYERTRIATPDDDFLDLDRISIGTDRIAVVLHGLEGSSYRPYIQGMAAALSRSGWDALAWNFRGCSGEPNRNLRFYHMGDTEDIHTVIQHVLTAHDYGTIALIGFSMGGNVVLKYLAEQGDRLPPVVRAAATFSVPCDLPAAAEKMDRLSNALYTMRFLVMLGDKIREKAKRFPELIDDEPVRRMRTFREFDEVYTAPIHGFASAEDYWSRSASKPLIHSITIPTLLVNALDDPFLSPSCYPYDEARANANFYLETPSHGGHVGFVSLNHEGRYWSEMRAVEFLERHGRSPGLPLSG
ncbi:MAG: YheT family hydrolase [Syntrophobacteraceae bacterium]